MLHASTVPFYVQFVLIDVLLMFCNFIVGHDSGFWNFINDLAYLHVDCYTH